jgi:hypothetical protein
MEAIGDGVIERTRTDLDVPFMIQILVSSWKTSITRKYTNRFACIVIQFLDLTTFIANIFLCCAVARGQEQLLEKRTYSRSMPLSV